MRSPSCLLSSFAVAALVASALSAAAPARAASQLTLVEVLSSPPRTDLLKRQIADFTKANPEISVNVVSVPYDTAFEKVMLMFKSGQIPDVIELADRWGGLFVRGKQLEPLDAWLSKTPELSTLQPRAIELGRVGTDKVYELPYGFLLRAVFYNKKMLQDAGVEPPRTFDEFTKVAAAVTEKLPGKYGYCMRAGRGAGVDWGLWPMNYGGTGAFFDEQGNSNYATPGFQAGMQKLVDLYRKGYAPKESISWGYADSVAGFASGTCAMLDQDPDALVGIRDKMDETDFGVVPLPTGPDGKAYPLLGYFNWAMTAHSEHKDDAWKLMAYLLAPKQNLEWAKFMSIIPAHSAADKDPFYGSEQWSGWFTMLEKSDIYKFYVMPAYLPEWGAFYDLTQTETGQAMLLGQKDVAATAKDWAALLTVAQKKYMANQ
jgi:multiple sugar transport system substrate-binding protein